MSLRTIVYAGLTVCLVFQQTQCASKEDYYDLYSYLFNATFYNKEVRPADSGSSSLAVFIEFELLSINDVDEKQQTLITSARLNIYWDDYYLSWDNTSFGGITSILAPQKNVFLPDIVVGNSVTTQAQLGYDQLRVRLYADGVIEWQPTLILSTSCDIDITYFPFDTQLCQIVLQTAVATHDEIQILIDTSNPIDIDSLSENGLWEVLDTFAENLGQDSSKSTIGFDIRLKRRRTYYVINIIMPIFFLSLTSSLVFALPGDEGEKMGVGITVLLSYTVYLSILSDLVPNTSLQVSILGMYLIILLAFSTISIIVCVFILRLHTKDDSEPVGPKVTKMTRFLEKFFFWRKNDDDNDKNQVSPIVSDDVELKGKSRISFARDHTEPPSEEPLTWKQVAYTLDLFCFMLFSFLAVFTTVICLFAVGVGGIINAP